jgi:phosphate transport system substrate-binding protein
MTTRIGTGIGLALCLALAGCGSGAQATGGSRIMIQNKGSDTMVNVVQAWAEEYRAERPNVAVAVSGGGSGTGIAALINGTTDVANASREMKREERDNALKSTGKAPVEHLVAFDALAIYVHASNPLARITRSQLVAIYGEEGTATRWSDLGVEVPGCAGQEIVRVGRQNNSGTYQYFREWALGEGDFKLGSRDMQGSKDVVDLIETTPCAIGYSGIGYLTHGVKALCVALADDGECFEPTPANTLTRRYPISRGLFMYTLGEPAGELAGYLDWIRSDAGQAIVERSGYVPLPQDQRHQPPVG